MGIVIRGLKTKDELEKLVQLLPTVFTKTPLKFFTSRFFNDPYLHFGDVRVAEENGEFISTVTVFRRKMWWQGECIEFGAIGNVATVPEKRGLGLSSTLMKDAINLMKKLSFPLSVLFTGINPFYEKFGYFTIPAHTAVIFPEADRKLKFSIRKFNNNDLGQVAELYEKFNRNLIGTLVRDLDYWQANLKFAEDDEIFLVAEDAGEIAAYLRMVPNHEKGDVWEFAYSDVEAFVDLLNYSAKMTGKGQMKTACFVPNYFFENSLPVKVEYEPSTLAMALVMDGTRFSENEVKEKLENYAFWWTDNF